MKKRAFARPNKDAAIRLSVPASSRAVFEQLEDRRLFCLPGDYFDITTGQFVSSSSSSELIAGEPVPAHAVPVLHSTALAADGPVLASATAGEWGPVVHFPGSDVNGRLNAIHSSLSPDGKIFTWDFWGAKVWDPAVLNDADPANDNQIASYNPPSNYFDSTNDYPNKDNRVDLLFCAGHSWLADGRLYVTGGQGDNGDGSINSAIWDPTSNTWSVGPDMNEARWYPTNTTMANGEVLIVSGRYYDFAASTYEVDLLPQVYNPLTNTLRDLTDAQLQLPLYPFMYQAPNGMIFNAGPQPMSRYLDTTGTGQWIDVDESNFGWRDYGTSVMYRPGKIMMAGGTNTDVLQGAGGGGYASAPTNTVETIDLNGASPTWQYADHMNFARRMNTAVVLPDGTVLMVGGSQAPGFNTAYTENANGTWTNEAVYTAELWNPDAPAGQQWTTLADMGEKRLYHSTALLLPDGRVWVGGGGDPRGELRKLDGTYAQVGTDTTSFQIFSPPYLSNGPRPTITTAPSDIGYTTPFAVTTPDTNIAKVTLVKLASVTHGFNMDQRYDELSFTQVGDTLAINGPSNPTVMPPGHYMLFVINDQGVPSVSKIVQLGLPIVGSLATSPVHAAGEDVILSAGSVSDPGGSVSGVGFYRETNGIAGLQIGEDSFIASDDDATDGYTATVSGLAVGMHAFYAVATDNEGNLGDAAHTSMEVIAAPKITKVGVRGSAWNPNYLPQGYAVPAGANQTKPLPWTNLNQIIVQFDKDVTVDTADLVVTSSRNGTYGVSSVSYNSATFTAVFTLATALINDKVRLNINGDTLSGVATPSGIRLDGEWTDGISAFASGDGLQGGSFRFRIDVLPGDVNQSGSVLNNDVGLVRNAQFTQPGNAHYSIFYDVNGTGSISAADVTLTRNGQKKTLPASDPALYDFVSLSMTVSSSRKTRRA